MLQFFSHEPKSLGIICELFVKPADDIDVSI